METGFITSAARVVELQRYMREHLPSARFVGNPIRLGSGNWQVCLALSDAGEIRLFNELNNKWAAEDAASRPMPKQTWLGRLLAWANFT